MWNEWIVNFVRWWTNWKNVDKITWINKVKQVDQWHFCNCALINPKRCVQGIGNEMFSLVKTNGTVPGQQIHVKIQVSGNRIRVYHTASWTSSLPNRIFHKNPRNQNGMYRNVQYVMASNNPVANFIKTTYILWIEQKKSEHQNLLMNKTFQKWINSIHIDSFKHDKDISIIIFHGNTLLKENRAEVHMNINFNFQISYKPLDHFTRDKVHDDQHVRIYTKHGMAWQNKWI